MRGGEKEREIEGREEGVRNEENEEEKRRKRRDEELWESEKGDEWEEEFEEVEEGEMGGGKEEKGDAEHNLNEVEHEKV